MTKQQRFEQTTSVLIRAFLRGHLVHNDTCACAVGNMIAADNGYRVQESPTGFYDWMVDGKMIVTKWAPYMTRMQYSFREIDRIETAFEGVIERPGVGYDLSLDPDGFRGLCAAIDTLMEIDDVETCHAQDVIALEGEFAEVAV